MIIFILLGIGVLLGIYQAIFPSGGYNGSGNDYASKKGGMYQYQCLDCPTKYNDATAFYGYDVSSRYEYDDDEDDGRDDDEMRCPHCYSDDYIDLSQ